MTDLVSVLTRPQPDERLLQEAGVGLDRALFPLLVRIGLYGPVGVVELADIVGRDHSTVIHAYNLIARRVGNDSAFRMSIEKIERELKIDQRAA